MGMMVRLPIVLVLACALAGPTLAAETTVDRTPVGRVIRQEGDGSVLRDRIRSSLLVGSAVFTDDVIETGAATRLTVQFADGSTLSAGPESRVVVAAYKVDATGARSSAIFSLLAGIVRAVVQKARLGEFAVQTDTTVASARSTEWTAEVTPAGTAVLGLDGVVEVRSRATGASVDLTRLQGSDVAPGRDPTPPVTWGSARVERTLQLIGGNFR
jgi:hypothetical protein